MILCTPSPRTAEIPWAALISGVVGIAGIAGSILTARFANRDAERRMRLQQEYEDGRRFHKERVELYGRVLGQAQTFRLKALELRQSLKGSGQTPIGWAAMTAVMVELSGTGKMAQLLGNTNTKDAAEKFLNAAGALGKGVKADDAEFAKLEERRTPTGLKGRGS